MLCRQTGSTDGDYDKQTEERTEDSVASDVGDSTFAVFLHGDFYVRGGNVALLTALLPRPRPAVAFIFLNDVQHLESTGKEEIFKVMG